MAEAAGAVGVILFSDPQEFSSNVNYPDSWFLPDTAIQRGNILKQKGDPLSPGYPSLGTGILSISHTLLFLFLFAYIFTNIQIQK